MLELTRNSGWGKFLTLGNSNLEEFVHLKYGHKKMCHILILVKNQYFIY